MLRHQYLFENRNELTGMQFARALGITPSHLSRIVNGRFCPSVQVAKKIEVLTEGQVKWHEVIDFCYNSKDKKRNIREI